MLKGVVATFAVAVLAAFLLSWPEEGGAWLARLIGFHLWAVFFSKLFFVDFLVLWALTRSMVRRAKGVDPWARVPAGLRRSARLAVEIYFGLLNPVLYLVVITSWPEMYRLRTDTLLGGWIAALHAAAAGLLAAVWGWRLFGPAIRPAPALARAARRWLMGTSLACLMVFAWKDLSLLAHATGISNWPQFLLALLALSPMYAVPGVLLYDYWRESGSPPGGAGSGFFLTSGRVSRAAIAAAAALAILTFAYAARLRSHEEVQGLIRRHRQAIRAAAARYDTDPRLIAAIVYVTHRDQLTPFRDSIERIGGAAWTFGLPDRSLNRALDLSLGLAQIKPRTLQTAAVLAAGGPKAFRRAGLLLIEHDGEGVFEPLGPGWRPPLDGRQFGLVPPIPVYASREEIVASLYAPELNLEICAFLLALYQRQWEMADPAWSIRRRPDILATLYQIGFGKSKPHAVPRSNAFGARVREVYEKRWLGELVAAQ